MIYGTYGDAKGVDTMTFLTKREIVDLIEQITDCENNSEENIDKLIEKLEQGVLDPQISDYIFWSDMTAEQIADKALGYKPIEL